MTNYRIGSALAAVALEALIVCALIFGLAAHYGVPVETALKLFHIAPPAPPPRVIEPDPIRSRLREGAASPPNLRAAATPVVAPPPIVRLFVPPPIIAAETPRSGTDPSAGAADVRGPGTGSGGVGNGNGSGGAGVGGGGGDDETPPRWRRGDLSDADFPASAIAGDFHGTVSVRYVVETTGRATQCAVTRSSGNAAIDATTCRLMEKRYRYDPALDAAGHQVPSFVAESHTWDLEHDRPAPRH